jgi:acyl-coenzyme A thioesterase PaaI-like protein
MAPPPPIDIDALRGIPATVVAPWVAGLDLQLQQARPGEVVLALPVAPRHVHGGSVLCMGRKLVFGEVHSTDAQGALAAQATTTCALT